MKRLNFFGISMDCRHNLQLISENEIVYSAGGTLVKENTNKNFQVLPLHDESITALDLSPNKKWVITGQKGTEQYKEKKAFIALVDLETFKMEKFFMEIEDGIVDL